MPEGHHVGIREDHLEAHPRLPGDDAVARVAGVLTEALLTARTRCPSCPAVAGGSGSGFRETGPVTAYATGDLTGMWWEA